MTGADRASFETAASTRIDRGTPLAGGAGAAASSIWPGIARPAPPHRFAHGDTISRC